MRDGVPRLRMFAGPNGSGKSTVKNNLHKAMDWYGIYINPDELEKEILSTGMLPLDRFGFDASADEVRRHFSSSTLLQMHGLHRDSSRIQCRNACIDFSGIAFNSYHASALSDWLRRRAMQDRRSFSFETVMSSADKVDLLREALKLGYRTYLYFIATEDPAINVQRVKLRFAQGGHDVPESKIVERYHRSLKLCADAVLASSRAFFFDTSGDEAVYFAEAVNGNELVIHSEEIPGWFEPIWSRLIPKR